MGAHRVLAPCLAAGALVLLGLLAAGCASGVSGGTEDIVAAVPFADGERLVYELVDADGEVVGHGTFTATAVGDTFELAQSYDEAETPSGERPIVDASLVVVDATTLKPLTAGRTIQRRDADEDESWSASYTTDEDGEPLLVTMQTRDGEERTHETKLRDHYYESQSSLWLWRTIDLDEDFEANYVSVNPQDRSQATAQLVMVDQQTLEVPAGTFETWRLQVRNGRDTRVAWIHVDPPHEVVQWDNGTLFFRLVEAGSR